MMNADFNKVVGEMFKKRGYKRTEIDCSTIRPSFSSNESAESKVEKFYSFLKKRTKYEVPKLSFETNFDFNEVKVSKNTIAGKEKKTKTTVEKNSEAKQVPKKFLKHVLTLGFRQEDASLLYEHKDQWVGVELDTKIKCTERGCDFKTEMHPNCLDEHCKKEHGWRDFPCEYKNCNWVSFSSTSYSQHKIRFHEGRCSTNLPCRCEVTGCEASFRNPTELKRHMNVHNNLGYQCSFCPYTNVKKTNFKVHLDHHFGNKSYKCVLCGSCYLTKGDLNQHVEYYHDAVQYKCPLCDKTGNIKGLRYHIRIKHNVRYFFDREKNQFVVQE